MSSNHHDNAFQERKRKLSVWVKRIIQPNKESSHFEATTTHTPMHAKTSERRRSLEQSRSSHVNAELPRTRTKNATTDDPKHGHRKRVPQTGSVMWDKSVTKDSTSATNQQLRLDFDQMHDNASTAPLVSHCSSSTKSSVFSEVASLQSTRATVLSNKTLDTNSSTVGIPPASILDRTRHTTNNPGAPSIFSLATTHHTSQANSMRQFSV
ncbi:LAFA_0G05754g1_1 [Lachancea sp. 'fantastica']|nr:LAFA_0G05754g1_1 [Lachancea sp. 'fantastica']